MTSPIKRLGVSNSRRRKFVLYNMEVPGDYNIVKSLPVVIVQDRLHVNNVFIYYYKFFCDNIVEK